MSNKVLITPLQLPLLHVAVAAILAAADPPDSAHLYEPGLDVESGEPVHGGEGRVEGVLLLHRETVLSSMVARVTSEKSSPYTWSSLNAHWPRGSLAIFVCL